MGIHLEEARAALDSVMRSVPRPSHLSTTEASLKFLTTDQEDVGKVIQLHKTDSLEILLAEHKEIDAIRAKLLNLNRLVPKPAEAARLLTEFKEKIIAHRATERRCVYHPLQTNHAAAGTLLNKRIENLVDEMNRDWARYLECWDELKMAERWEEFVIATNSLLLRAGERMRLEEHVIYPLAFMSGAIQLRAPTE